MGALIKLSKDGIKRCPKCNEVSAPVDDRQAIEDLFGYRWMNGARHFQSWCKVCRRAGAKGGAKEKKEEPMTLKYPTPEAPPPPCDPTPEEIEETYLASQVEEPPEVTVAVIAGTKAEITEMYCAAFPGDSNKTKRAFKFMVQRLARKYPKALISEPLKTMFFSM